MFKNVFVIVLLGLFSTAPPFVQGASSQAMEHITTLVASDPGSLDQFGKSVSVSGDVVIVGAHQDDDLGGDSGSAYIFERDFNGSNSWGEAAKLTASDGTSADHFGVSVSVSGDTALIGAHTADASFSQDGAAYIFKRDPEGIGGWEEVAKLTASDGAENDRFGRNVSISGDTALVGAYEKDVAAANSGAAYIFERNEGDPETWDEIIRLVAFDGGGSDSFGVSVSIYGDVAVIGAHGDDDKGNNAGAVYVFERNHDGLNAWGNVAKLTASDGAAGHYFGIKASVSENRILIGASYKNGAGADSGAAYIFDRNQEGVWEENAKLTASDAAGDDRFGAGVSIRGDIAVVGAPLDDDQGVDSGSLYIYTRDQGAPGAWGQAGKVVVADGAAGDAFGYVLSMGDGLLAAGMFFNDGEAEDAGAAYIFEPVGNPELAIPAAIPAGPGDVVSVPIEFTSNGNDIAGVAFSIDFDETCLDFDPTDGNADDIPDAIEFSVPVHFDLSVFVDLADGDGEIDIVIADLTDTAPISDGSPVSVNFTTTCTPNPGETIIAPVLFSSDPSASFGNAAAQSLPGVTVDGSVEITSGIRGDCNGDGVVDVADVLACSLEIFDGDGNLWRDTPGGTFVGNPVGCDSNADTNVDAGDISCTSRLIFGLTCPGFGARRAAARRPSLELAPRLNKMDQGVATARIHFAPGDHEINSVVFSLNINEDVLEFDDRDLDRDGRPDAVRFSGVRTSHMKVKFDASDKSGELDFIIADLTQHPESIEAGVLVEIEFRLMGPDGALDNAVSFSREVNPSFGSSGGRGIAGDVYVDRPIY